MKSPAELTGTEPNLPESRETSTASIVSTAHTADVAHVKKVPELVESNLQCGKQTAPMSNKAKQGRYRLPLLNWFLLLWELYGYFAPLSMLAYGLQHSFGRGVGAFACKYYMMDVLHLDGATMGRLLTVAHVPWCMKPLMGMLCDALPVLGYHRTSYLVIAIVLTILASLWFGFFELGWLQFVFFMIAANVGLALADVVLDAAAARLGKKYPENTSDLQCAIKSADATFGIVAGGIKGYMLEVISAQGTVLVNAVLNVIILIPVLLGWLPEERLPKGQRCVPNVKEFRRHPMISAVSVLVAGLAMILSVLQLFIEDARIRVAVTVICAAGVGMSAPPAMWRISPYLGKTALFIFLRLCLQPGLGEAMFVWMTRYPDGPQLSTQLMGITDCFGQVAMLLGVIVYRRFMTNWSYRKIFLVGQVAFFIGQLLDIVLVMRWNQVIGIPDVLFYVGDEAFDNAVSRLFYLPLLVLAYKVCPANLEATLFATMMAMAATGHDVGRYTGVSLCEFWGLVGGNFDFLVHGLLTKAFCRLLCIPLIFILVPRQLTPNDPIPMPFDEDEEPGGQRDLA